jgi:hypothetical protein
MMRFVDVITLAVIAISLPSPAAHAASPAVVVLEISDAPDAQIDAPSEIERGTTIALGKKGRIKFVHYLSCNEVTAVGGMITVSATDYTFFDGQISEVRVPCPERVLLRTSVFVAAGINGPTRDLPADLPISLHPIIVVINKHVPDSMGVVFQKIAFDRNANALIPTGAPIETKVINHFVQIPDEGLNPGRYRLTWTSPNGQYLRTEASVGNNQHGQSLLVVSVDD